MSFGPGRATAVHAVTLGALVTAAGVGLLAAFSPSGSVVAGGVLGALVLGAAYAERLPRAFLLALGALLLVYAAFGKGGAYLNVGGLFIGELVLGFGLLTALLGGVLPLAFRSPIAWCIAAFAALGALRTIPYVPAYGRDALRDGVVWGYGIFALLTAACLAHTGLVEAVVARYGRVLRWYPLWVPLLWAIFTHGGDRAPTVPGSGGTVPLLFFKSGDAAFHLTGIAAFVLLGLHESPSAGRTGPRHLGGWLWWVAWVVAFALTAATSRASTLAMVLALAPVPLIQPATRLWRPSVTVLALATLFFASDVRIQVREGRYLSPQEMVANLEILGGRQTTGNRDATREWRLNWWKDIVDYTVFGPYFLTGKGFGINLADDDGYQVEDDPSPLRSPHNGHLNILARAGVPGLLLWVVMQGAFALALIRAYLRMRAAGEEWWARVDLWLLAYWTVFQVNSAFEVALEGPHGGIWFWCLVGFGMAALERQRHLLAGRRAERLAWTR